MFYISDIFGEGIQYGARTKLCYMVKQDKQIP